MPDDYSGNGGNGNGRSGWGSGPRQVTHQRIDGWDDVVIAIRDTLILVVVSVLGVALLLVLSLLAGPWVLVPLVPGALHQGYLWLYDAEPWDRVALSAWGVVVAVVLLALPEAALLWWPWRWQATRVSWWGLLWPARWPNAIPAVAFVRFTIAVGLHRGWSEVWYLVQRLRQEIIAPTLSSLAYNAPDPADVEIDGYANPYGRKVEPPKPRPETRPDIPFRGKARLVPDVLTEDGNGHDEPVTRTFRKSPPPTLSATAQSVKMIPDTPTVVDFPVGLFVMPTEAERWAAELLASGSRKVSANAMHPHYCSEPRSREVRDWLEARNYAERANARLWLLTDDGVELLRHVAAGRWREWREEAVEA